MKIFSFEPKHGYLKAEVDFLLFKTTGEGKTKLRAVANAIKNILPNPPRKSFLTVAIESYPDVPDINDFIDQYTFSPSPKGLLAFLELTKHEFNEICAAIDDQERTVVVRNIVKKHKGIKK